MIPNIGIARYARVASEMRISRRPDRPARRLRAASRRRDAVIVVIGLAAVARLPWDSRAQQHAIMLAIGLAAAAALARENQARSLARLVAWDQRQNLRQSRVLKAGS
jgi:hypothetical protein